MTGGAVSRASQVAAPVAADAADEEPFPQFKLSLAYQAQFLARLLQNDYMGRIAETGVAPAQSYVLGELWFNEPLSQVELARRLDIGKATVGQTLNRLERAGLIERRRLPADRRVIMIHLTEEGHRVREPLRLATLAQSAMIDERLGADEVAELTRLLMRATRALPDVPPPDVIGDE